MINFNRGSGDRPPEPQEARPVGKPVLRPAPYEPMGSHAAQGRALLPPDPASVRETPAPAPRVDVRADSHATERHAPGAAHPAPAPSPASKLFVGVNIKLKGVEITDCDLIVVEGNVEATVHSKEMEILPPGTLRGTAMIDVAEVHGEFTGELTARTRLVVHGTGKVSGTIRYGKLIVAEGGTISGDMKQIDAVETKPAAAPTSAPTSTPARPPTHESRHSGPSSRGSGAN